MAVQLSLELPDEVIFSVELQFQLIDEGVTLSELLDLGLQGKLEVSQGSHGPGTHTSTHIQIHRVSQKNQIYTKYRHCYNYNVNSAKAKTRKIIAEMTCK